MQAETRYYNFSKATAKWQVAEERSKLDKCIKSIVKKEGYITCEVTKTVLPVDGGNYLARLCEIYINGKTDNEEKETAIFVKSIGSGSDAMEIISIPRAFKIELFFYNKLIKIYSNLQNEVNMPLSKRYNTIKCYEESYEKTIFMENISKKGFKTWYRMDVIPLCMAEESIKQLARFHALSFVIEKRYPDMFNRKIKPLKSSYCFGNAWDKFIEKSFKSGLERLTPDLRRRVEKMLPNLMNNIEQYQMDKSVTCCLCHGDYRANNVMIKEVKNIVTEAIPIDYQLAHYGCPVLDIFYFMYMACDREFRDRYTVHLKNVYYKSLDDFLRYFYMSAESVFPRKTFDSLYQEKLDYGLSVSFVVAPLVFVSETEEVPDITTQAIDEIEFKLDERYNMRLKGAVEEFIDLGYL